MDWNAIAENYLAVANEIFRDRTEMIEDVAADLAERVNRGNKVLICGNGGSAADAQHFVGEMLNRFLMERRPYPAIALTTDTSVMTAIGNDYGYEFIFEKQVQGLGKEGDALIAISTSGQAENVCQAVHAAKEMGIETIALTGGTGGRLAEICDKVISVSCTKSTPRIQEGHSLIIHVLCERIEEILQ